MGSDLNGLAAALGMQNGRSALFTQEQGIKHPPLGHIAMMGLHFMPREDLAFDFHPVFPLEHFPILGSVPFQFP